MPSYFLFVYFPSWALHESCPEIIMKSGNQVVAGILLLSFDLIIVMKNVLFFVI